MIALSIVSKWHSWILMSIFSNCSKIIAAICTAFLPFVSLQRRNDSSTLTSSLWNLQLNQNLRFKLKIICNKSQKHLPWMRKPTFNLFYKIWKYNKFPYSFLDFPFLVNAWMNNFLKFTIFMLHNFLSLYNHRPYAVVNIGTVQYLPNFFQISYAWLSTSLIFHTMFSVDWQLILFSVI